MSERLYLIRRKFEKILGPYNFKGFKKAYKNLEIEYSDEVSAGNKEWVYLSDIDKINDLYPEVIHFLKDDFASPWKNPKKSKSEDFKLNSNSGVFKKIMLMVASIFLVCGSFYMVKHQSQVFKLYSKSPLLIKAETHYQKKNWQELKKILLVNKLLLPKLISEKSEERKTWVKILRSSFYREKGELSGISPQWIYLNINRFKMSTDCSVKSWKKDILKDTNTWNRFLKGRINYLSDFYKLLLWDSHWISKRMPENNWGIPRSSYSYCLTFAYIALEELISNSRLGKEKIKNLKLFRERIKFILALVNKDKNSNKFALEGPIWKLSCYELSPSLAKLSECNKLSTKRMGRIWRQIMEERYSINGIRLLSSEKLLLKSQKQVIYDSFLKNMNLNKSSPMGMNYQSELNYYKKLFQN